MAQLILFDPVQTPGRLETHIERVGDTLSIPEGLRTIPCTHGLHRFPGKFIPNLPRFLLRTTLKKRKGCTILDPFCGSGTTLVEAALEGRPFVGFDIDPLAVAIANAKVTPLEEAELSLMQEFWMDFDYCEQKPDLVPTIPNLQHWFSDVAIAQLSAIKFGCLSLPPRARHFSLVVFSSIIRRVSNADDQTQKTYVSHTLPKSPPAPEELFPIFLQRAIEGMRQYTSLLRNSPSGRILKADARQLPDVEFDDVLTSPPYIDSIDYVYNQMLEYFWLLNDLAVNTYEGYRSLRKAAMGFASTAAESLDQFEESFLSEVRRRQFSEACKKIGACSPKEETVVRTFFHDFATHCEMIYGRQERGAFYVCIVGNSMIRQVNVPSADLLVDIFRSAGYKLEDRTAYEIKRHYMKFPRRSNSGKIKQDHILVFRK